MSNKTPKENEKKTKSAHSHQRLIATLSLVVISITICVCMVFAIKSFKKPVEADKASRWNDCPIVIPAAPSYSSNSLIASGGKNWQCVSLEVAETNQQRIKGLSDRDHLLNNRGMLFVFDKTGEQCMWMKDMKFAIDMIWLDENKKILKIERDLKPESYPSTFCSENTKYVIELSSGIAANAGLEQGQSLNL